MKQGIFDISQLETSQIFVEGSLSVRVKKLISLISVVLPTAFLLFFFIMTLNLKMYLKAFFALLVFSIGIKPMIAMYRFAISLSPYIFIDNEGIVFKKKSISGMT
jgi:hypothetical protein